MTATAAPVAAQPAPSARAPLPIGGVPVRPQVNLLPPEVRAARTLRSVKRLLVVGLVGVVALTAVLSGAAAFSVTQAQAELEREQAETRRLLTAQQEYAEVPVVLNDLSRARDARLLGTTTEVLWSPYLASLMTTAPVGVAFTQLAVSGASPTQPAPLPAHPLQQESELQLSFSGRSLTLPDTSAWVEALNSIEGFQDAWVSSASITEGTSGSMTGVVHYTVSGTVQISSEAFAERFSTEED